jgi:hypothetical protein
MRFAFAKPALRGYRISGKKVAFPQLRYDASPNDYMTIPLHRGNRASPRGHIRFDISGKRLL